MTSDERHAEQAKALLQGIREVTGAEITDDDPLPVDEQASGSNPTFDALALRLR